MAVIIVCTNCGSGFIQRRKWHRFCSTSCRAEYWRNKQGIKPLTTRKRGKHVRPESIDTDSNSDTSDRVGNSVSASVLEEDETSKSNRPDS